jgi:hypothetical protein
MSPLCSGVLDFIIAIIGYPTKQKEKIPTRKIQAGILL